MTLLFILTPAFNPNDGGVQRTTYKLGKYFTENGIKVSYFSFAVSGHVDVKYGSLFNARYPGSCKNADNLKFLENCFKEVSPDVIINQMPYERPIGIFLSSLRKDYNFILLGCLRNSLFSFKSNVKEIIKSILPRFLYQAINNQFGIGVIQYYHKVTHSKQLKEIITIHDRFILLTPKNRDELVYFIGTYKSEKVLSIPNSIPEVCEKLPLKEKILLFVGRMNIAQKRADLLIPVWQRLYKCAPDWKLIIVGDGSYLPELKLMLNEHNIGNVEIVGHDSPEKYYLRASIFLMTSAYEGFPNVIIEAQSFGVVPVVFDSYASLSWIVNDGVDSFLIDPFNCDMMSDKILSLMNNSKLLETMMESSLKNARRFTIENVGKKWLELFIELQVL